MEDIFKTHVQRFLDDTTYLESTCYVCKDPILQDRRKKILRTNVLNKFNSIIQDFKDCMKGIIVRLDTGYIMNEMSVSYFKYLMEEFLETYAFKSNEDTLENKETFVKYFCSRHLVTKYELSNIDNYFQQPQLFIKTNIKYLDPVYRMKIYKKGY